MDVSVIEKYKCFLGKRYSTFQYAFSKFKDFNGKVIVELGTTRSFVKGGEPGCMSDDPIYWNKSEVSLWDWGAGCFTRVCAEFINDSDIIFHTVDPLASAMSISKKVTEEFKEKINYHQATSTEFLKGFDDKIDLLYMDHHETCEEGARLHIQDSKIMLEKNILSDNGIILIDDINTDHVKPGLSLRNMQYQIKKFFDKNYKDRGKGKYSIPYLQRNGFSISREEYQVVMERNC